MLKRTKSEFEYSLARMNATVAWKESLGKPRKRISSSSAAQAVTTYLVALRLQNRIESRTGKHAGLNDKLYEADDRGMGFWDA